MSILQGVPQNSLRFSISNFSAYDALKNLILDIFQQPFPCRFQNYQIFYYLVKFWPRYCQNTKRKSSWKSIFFYITVLRTWTLRLILNYSEALMSVHEHSYALLSINEYGAKPLWVLNLPWCNECLLSLMSAVKAIAPYSWVPMAAYECLWVLMSA